VVRREDWAGVGVNLGAVGGGAGRVLVGVVVGWRAGLEGWEVDAKGGLKELEVGVEEEVGSFRWGAGERAGAG
jgi:hypothetical protein